MVMLTKISEDSILDNLRKRFMADQIYVRTVIVMNTNLVLDSV